MGLINSALQVGRSALLTYQTALQVVGTNISNAGNADYTRQTPGLSSINGSPVTEGMRPGAGVAMTTLQRHLDEALENRLRAALGNEQRFVAQRRAMGFVEGLFDPLTGMGVQERMTELFNAMDQVQNAPADNATRDLAVAAGTAFATSLRQLRSELAGIGETFNEQIGAMVIQANDLSNQIASLNTEIVSTEASGSPASALRDQRDALLRELGAMVELRVRPQESGSVNVYVGNEVLVEGGRSRGFKVVSRLDGEFKRDTVAFADNNSQVPVGSGSLAGIIAARDENVFDRIAGIDDLAGAMIHEFNRAFSNGQGQVGFTSVTSTRTVADPTAVLGSSEAGLPFEVANGSFYIAVTDEATGTTRAAQIEIDLDGIGDDTTLESLVADINEKAAGVTASITVDNRLELTADAGLSFDFGFDGQTQRDDTSGVLASLGVNTFFAGSSATDIAVNAQVANDPRMFAAAAVRLAGDGANAGRLASVADATIESLGGITLFSMYDTIASEVAVAAATAGNAADAAGSVLSSLQAQKENISGVSLDEEAIALVKFERAFQGAARFVNVVNRLSAEMLALVR